MFYAIDRLRIGFEEEVTADTFYGEYIVRKKDRFFCPECGEKVYWRSRGGFNPDMFYHQVRTSSSPECDKRVDGKSNLYIYQRVGLPLRIAHRGNSFLLYMAFPAITESMIENAVNYKTKISISDGSAGGFTKTFPIDFTYFQPDRQNLLPMDFVPVQSDYSISIENLGNLYALKLKWASHSEGFSNAGAIFTQEDDGARRVKRGDSICPGKHYYLITKNYQPFYKEISITPIGHIRLNRTLYSVFDMVINVSVLEESTYMIISSHLKRNFGVWLLETVPELIPLWPPITEQDVMVPLGDGNSVICAVSSGNTIPRVFNYEKNKANSVPVSIDDDGNCTTELPLYGHQETIASVDRKYVGREVVIRKKLFDYIGGSYELSLWTDDGEAVPENEININRYHNQLTLKANAKTELYVKSKDYIIAHLAVRENKSQIPILNKAQEIIFTAEQGVIKRLLIAKKEIGEDTARLTLPKLSDFNKNDYVPVPRWIGYLLLELGKAGETETVQRVSLHIRQGKIPYSLLLLLVNNLDQYNAYIERKRT